MNRQVIIVKFQTADSKNNSSPRIHRKIHLLINLAFSHKNHSKKIFHLKISSKNMKNLY
jgi:hypothetical protein